MRVAPIARCAPTRLPQAARCQAHVALAGLLHSVYGTSTFAGTALSAHASADRARVAGAAGAAAERLAFLFSVVKRPWCFQQRPLEDARAVAGADPGRVLATPASPLATTCAHTRCESAAHSSGSCGSSGCSGASGTSGKPDFWLFCRRSHGADPEGPRCVVGVDADTLLALVMIEAANLLDQGPVSRADIGPGPGQLLAVAVAQVRHAAAVAGLPLPAA
jgi:hypothetical protein